jgi:hypothetical protein
VQVLILGINHQIQWVRIWSYSSGGELERFEQGQKDQFRELLRKRISERGVQFIGEETKHGEPSIANEVCASTGCCYANIEMHPDERIERKIPANYESDPNVRQAQKTRFHQQREEYMFERVVGGTGDAKSIIVICGRYHTPGLASRLRGAGHQVDESDIQVEPWYVEDWMEHMMRM